MSSVFNYNVPITVPPVHDTTPCMQYMLTYEDCVLDAVPRNAEVYHPNWPTMWPRLLTDGRLRPDLWDDETHEKGPMMAAAYRWNKPIAESVKEKLWECEEERFLYKACLRKMLSVKHDPRTRYPFWQPEENYPRSMGERIFKQKDNRYPTDYNHGTNIDKTLYMRYRWPKIVEDDEDIS
jgi:hypothetical protein